MYMINKTYNDISLNTLIDIKITTYIYEAQNTLNLDRCQKHHISYIVV